MSHEPLHTALSHAYKAQMQAKLNHMMFNVQIFLSHKKVREQCFINFSLMGTFEVRREGK